MTKPTNQFQTYLDLAVDMATDLATDLLGAAADAKSPKPAAVDPLDRLLKGVSLAFDLGNLMGKATEKPAPAPAAPTDDPRVPPSARNGWSAATDDVTAPSAPASTYSPEYVAATERHLQAHRKQANTNPITADLAVKDLPAKCANMECPNLTDQGGFVIVETSKNVVSKGVRGIRLWMCSPCASGLIGGGM